MAGAVGDMDATSVQPFGAQTLSATPARGPAPVLSAQVADEGSTPSRRGPPPRRTFSLSNRALSAPSEKPPEPSPALATGDPATPSTTVPQPEPSEAAAVPVTAAVSGTPTPIEPTKDAAPQPTLTAPPPAVPAAEADHSGGNDDNAGGEGGGEDAQVKCGEFLFKQNGRVCKALFIPDGQRLNSVKMEALLAGWNLERPTIMVSADAGTVHPKMFAAPKLVQLKQFDKYWADALQHADIANAGEAKEAFALGVVNDVIFLKLQTIFVSVIDAASIAKNWIIIDRVNAKSPAAELLIESAMAQTTARPTVIVIDSYTRLQNFKGKDGKGQLCKATKACMDSMELARKGGVPLGTDDAPAMASIDIFYSVDEYDNPLKYIGMELLRKPEPTHVGPNGELNIPE